MGLTRACRLERRKEIVRLILQDAVSRFQMIRCAARDSRCLRFLGPFRWSCILVAVWYSLEQLRHWVVPYISFWGYLSVCPHVWASPGDLAANPKSMRPHAVLWLWPRAARSTNVFQYLGRVLISVCRGPMSSDGSGNGIDNRSKLCIQWRSSTTAPCLQRDAPQAEVGA